MYGFICIYFCEFAYLQIVVRPLAFFFRKMDGALFEKNTNNYEIIYLFLNKFQSWDH